MRGVYEWGGAFGPRSSVEIRQDGIEFVFPEHTGDEMADGRAEQLRLVRVRSQEDDACTTDRGEGIAVVEAKRGLPMARLEEGEGFPERHLVCVNIGPVILAAVMPITGGTVK